MKSIEVIPIIDGSLSMDINVSIEEETVWMTADQIAILLNRNRPAIAKHIRNIYIEKELEKGATCAKDAQVRFEGNRKVSRPLDYYSLAVILAIGERIKFSMGQKLADWLRCIIDERKRENAHPIVVFDNCEISIDVVVSPEEETIWLTQKQIADLYETTRQNISLHISNILAEGEINESIGKEYLHIGTNGKPYFVALHKLDIGLQEMVY